MPAEAEPKPDPIPISPWKKTMLILVALLFGGTLFEYYRGGIDESGGWLWPMLFVPLILYLLGIVYGDVPARYYDLKVLKPFPVPFARQFDRCVLAIIVLFTGLFLNLVLLAVSLIVGAKLMLIVFYLLYMVLMLAELPNSLRIFRFIQHVNTVQYVSAIHPNTFKKAIAYYSPEQDQLCGEELKLHLGEVYKQLVTEAEELVIAASPLTRDQQIALNLAVRAGEAIRRSRIANQSQECERLRANIFLLEALEENAGLVIPKDTCDLRNRIKGMPVADENAKLA